MEPTGNDIRDNLISAILTFIAASAMAYAVIGLAAAFFPQWDPRICLLFCLLCGILHTIAVCAGQPRLSLILIPGVVLLAALCFHSWRTAAEIAAGCAVCGLSFRIRNFDRPRQAVTAGLILVLAVFHLSGTAVPLPRIAACLLCVLTELAGSPVHPRRDHGLRLIPFLILLEAAILLLPAGEEPFDWSFVIRIGNRVSDLAQDVIVNMEYRFSSDAISDRWNAGYGNPNLFGGRFSDDSRIELSVSDRGTRNVLYLSGEEYAGYDDGRWTKGPADGLPFISWYLTFLDCLDRRQTTPEQAACFAETASTAILYQHLRTSDVIRPSMLLRADDSLLSAMTGDDGSFSFRRSQTRGRRYDVTFMDLDYANPYLTEILRAAGSEGSENSGTENGGKAGNEGTGTSGETAQEGRDDAAGKVPSYDHLEDVSFRLFHLPLSTLISRTDYEAHAADIFHPDLTAWLDTGGTPERVAHLAEEITKNCENAYDRCKAIERYLRQYPYTKDVDYRGYVNFIDAFLFEVQKGYCIHYASAMVMMLRGIGIPARLTEGYLYDYGIPSENGYDIPGRYAHTWPEAYLDGFGWVRFEPTAAVASADEYGWNLLVVEEIPENDTATENNAYLPSGPASPSNGSGPETPAITETSDSEERPGRLAAWLFFGVCIPAVYLLLLLIILPALRRYRYRRMDDSARLAAELADLLWLIRRLYPGCGENRPLLDYAALLKDASEAEAMTKICLAYYRFRYRGGREGTAAEKGAAPDTEAGAGSNETSVPDLRQTSLRLRQALYRQYIDSSDHGRLLRRLTAYVSLNRPSG